MKKQQKTSSRTKSASSVPKSLVGTITISPKQVGTVFDPIQKVKVIIYLEDLHGALHGDHVTVSARRQKSPGVYQGRIEKIHSHAKQGYSGILKKEQNGVLVLEPQDPRMYMRIEVTGRITKEAIGKKVFVSDLIHKKHYIEAKKCELLGESGSHETEIQSIIREQGFAYIFPKEVLEEAKRYGEPTGNDYKQRLDIRDVLTFTIDPFDAKDFDDALSIKKVSDTVYEVGIHIADVSHYVKPNTALDKEAYKRGTSIYLVDRTIPMLPEKLSNDLCSLKPNVDRLAMSVILQIKTDGTITKRWYGRTIIHSDKRFTYEEAWDNINNPTGLYHEELVTLNNIAKILRKEREENGSLEFAGEEIKCILNPDNTVKAFIRKERNDAHKLIEEYMLLANREIAALWNPKKLKKGHELFLFRTHDVPNAEKLALLESIATALGYEIPKTKKRVTQRDIQQFLKMIHRTPHEGFLSTLMIRAMSKAIYSTRATGHFGLALEDYTHFTSPIRRYPDIVVHRFLTDYLEHRERKYKPKEFEAIAAHTSLMEKNAAQAERDSLVYKQIEYMLSRKTETFTGTITGVIERGIFIAETYSGSEGMVSVERLVPGTWVYNEKTYSFANTATQEILRLGDHVCFKVYDGDPLSRRLDYTHIVCEHSSKK